jgi:hypothetical protein
MRSVHIILFVTILSLFLSACNEDSNPETTDTANSAEQESLDSSDEEETSEDTDGESGQEVSDEQSEDSSSDDSNSAPSPVTTPPASESSQEITAPVVVDSGSAPDAPAETSNSDTQETESGRGAATLTSASLSGEDILLNWTQSHTPPEGGYDIVIDNVDTDAVNRTMATSTAIVGLDLTREHCFQVEARYVQTSEFHRSAPLCVEAQTSPNQAPTIGGTPPTSVDTGTDYRFIPVVNDEDGDALNFSVVNLPSWAQFDSNNGTLSGIPGVQDVGDYNSIQINVSDGTETVSLVAFSISVNRAEEVVAETGSMSLVWSAPATRTDGSPLNLSDISGYYIHVGTTRENLQMYLDVNQGDIDRYTIDNIEIGDYFVAVTVYDRTGNTSDLSNIVRKSVVN